MATTKPRNLKKPATTPAAAPANDPFTDQNALIDHMKEDTEAKSPGPQPGDFAPDPDTWDMSSIPGPDPEPDPVNDGDFTPPPPPAAPDPQTVAFEPKNLLSPETSSDIVIGIIDQVQQHLFKALYKWKARRKIGTGEEFEKFMELCKSVNDGVDQFENLEISDRAKVRIAQRMLKQVDTLPFTEMEWDQMAEALTLIMREMPQYQLPPSWGFTLALSQALLPRAIEVIME